MCVCESVLCLYVCFNFMCYFSQLLKVTVYFILPLAYSLEWIAQNAVDGQQLGATFSQEVKGVTGHTVTRALTKVWKGLSATVFLALLPSHFRENYAVVLCFYLLLF